MRLPRDRHDQLHHTVLQCVRTSAIYTTHIFLATYTLISIRSELNFLAARRSTTGRCPSRQSASPRILISERSNLTPTSLTEITQIDAIERRIPKILHPTPSKIRWLDIKRQ